MCGLIRHEVGLGYERQQTQVIHRLNPTRVDPRPQQSLRPERISRDDGFDEQTQSLGLPGTQPIAITELPILAVILIHLGNDLGRQKESC